MTGDFLKVILNESDRMTHIVQDLLTLSRFDSGYSQLNLTRFPFAAVLEDSYQAVRIEAQRHGHQLLLEGTEGLPNVRGDREQDFAGDYEYPLQRHQVYPRRWADCHVRRADRERVWLEVADNGIGIPDGDRERIFERFYRVVRRCSRESRRYRAWDSPLPRRSSASMRAASAWWSGPAPAPPCGWS